MVAFGHSSVGVLTGVAAVEFLPQNISLWVKLLVVVLAGIVSHYVFDAIPHGHYGMDPKHPTIRSMALLFFDLVGVFLLFVVLAYSKFGISPQFYIVIFAIFGCQLPDVWLGIKKFVAVPDTGLVRFEEYLHKNVAHWHNESDSPIPGHGRPWRWTDIWQIIVFIFALILIVKV